MAYLFYAPLRKATDEILGAVHQGWKLPAAQMIVVFGPSLVLAIPVARMFVGTPATNSYQQKEVAQQTIPPTSETPNAPLSGDKKTAEPTTEYPSFKAIDVAGRLKTLPPLRFARYFELVKGEWFAWNFATGENGTINGEGPGLCSVFVRPGIATALCYFTPDEVSVPADQLRFDENVVTMADIIQRISGGTTSQDEALDLTVKEIMLAVSRGDPFGETKFEICGRKAFLIGGTQNIPAVKIAWRRRLFAVLLEVVTDKD